MARPFPAVSPDSSYAIRLTAAESDIDELGHVSNIVYVRWLQEVAQAHSRACGWDIPEYRAIGAVFVVRRHEIDYFRPVYARDAVLATTWVAGFSGASCERCTRFVRESDGLELARGVTTWVFVSSEGGRPKRIPDELARAFNAKRWSRKETGGAGA
ncbi:MAG TPA: acyl-CoA thioesterase [Polyangiaceae bacterium]|nr:acyl-CoA thioesterase [Polyangiaceae bacterium]